jgi:glycosyltransferase involved in cell wall biosynthesis
MPKISVVTSVYNGEDFLEECVNSVLKQTFQDFEYIILNDGSTDRTSEILDRYTDPRLRIVHQRNLGISQSLNKGISLCQADLIAHLDADDYVNPHWLEKHFDFLNQNQDVIFCNSRFEELFNGKLYPQSFPFIEQDHEIRKSLCFMNTIPHSFIIFRKSSLIKTGGYDPKLIIAHDYDLWVRLLEEGKVHNLNEILGVHRIHGASITKKKERTMIKEAFQVQWRAYRKLGGSFWKMVWSLSKRGMAFFFPISIRSFFRTIKRK